MQDALSTYQQYQAEFKEVHKTLDKMHSTGGTGKPSPAELRKEIQQLEDERTQLIEKIAGLKKKTADIPGFAVLFEATSNLRKEQEEEGKLAERMHEQRASLQAAERRYAEVNRRLAETRAATNEDMSAENVLESTRREALENRQLAKKALPSSIDARRETLVTLTKMLSEPAKVSLFSCPLTQFQCIEPTFPRLCAVGRRFIHVENSSGRHGRFGQQNDAGGCSTAKSGW